MSDLHSGSTGVSWIARRLGEGGDCSLSELTVGCGADPHKLMKVSV